MVTGCSGRDWATERLDDAEFGSDADAARDTAADMEALRADLEAIGVAGVTLSSSPGSTKITIDWVTDEPRAEEESEIRRAASRYFSQVEVVVAPEDGLDD